MCCTAVHLTFQVGRRTIVAARIALTVHHAPHLCRLRVHVLPVPRPASWPVHRPIPSTHPPVTTFRSESPSTSSSALPLSLDAASGSAATSTSAPSTARLSSTPLTTVPALDPYSRPTRVQLTRLTHTILLQVRVRVRGGRAAASSLVAGRGGRPASLHAAKSACEGCRCRLLRNGAQRRSHKPHRPSAGSLLPRFLPPHPAGRVLLLPPCHFSNAAHPPTHLNVLHHLSQLVLGVGGDSGGTHSAHGGRIIPSCSDYMQASERLVD